jgi:hypothetical protein
MLDLKNIRPKWLPSKDDEETFRFSSFTLREIEGEWVVRNVNGTILTNPNFSAIKRKFRDLFLEKRKDLEGLSPEQERNLLVEGWVFEDEVFDENNLKLRELSPAELKTELDNFCNAMRAGYLTLQQAKQRSQPIIDEMNRRARDLAERYGRRKPRPFRFSDFSR